MTRYGIIGYGVVGKATAYCLSKRKYKWWALDTAAKVPSKNAFKPAYLEQTSVVFVCVPTRSCDRGYDLSNVKEALYELLEQGYTQTVVVVSTLGIGDFAVIEEAVRHRKFALTVCPEFLREASAGRDMWLARQTYYYGPKLPEAQDIVLRQALQARHYVPQKYICADADTCAAYKTGRNLSLAMKLTSASIAYLTALPCGGSNVDASRLVSRIFEDTRLHSTTPYHNVGKNKHKLGFGGNCLPKDVKALSENPNLPYAAQKFLRSVNEFNEWLREYYE